MYCSSGISIQSWTIPFHHSILLKNRIFKNNWLHYLAQIYQWLTNWCSIVRPGFQFKVEQFLWCWVAFFLILQEVWIVSRDEWKHLSFLRSPVNMIKMIMIFITSQYDQNDHPESSMPVCAVYIFSKTPMIFCVQL